MPSLFRTCPVLGVQVKELSTGSLEAAEHQAAARNVKTSRLASVGAIIADLRASASSLAGKFKEVGCSR